MLNIKWLLIWVLQVAWHYVIVIYSKNTSQLLCVEIAVALLYMLIGHIKGIWLCTTTFNIWTLVVIEY